MTSVVQSLWIGDRLSTLERLSVCSFLANGHEYHLYVYDDVKNVPSEVSIKDANEILPHSDVFKVNGSLALFADWFRWELLLKSGGIWVDMDLVCLRPLDFADTRLFGWQDSELVAIGVLGFEAGDELCRLMAYSCENPNVAMPYDGPKEWRRKFKGRLLRNPYRFIKWSDLGGPSGFTRALQAQGATSLAKPYTWFYPIPVSHWTAFFSEGIYPDQKIGTELFANSYTIHVWNEYFRRHKVDKDAVFPASSLYEQLKSVYL